MEFCGKRFENLDDYLSCWEFYIAIYKLCIKLLLFQLIPLVVVIAAGGCMSAGYLARLAFKSPDVTWNRSGNPEPWEKYRTKQYKVSHWLFLFK